MSDPISSTDSCTAGSGPRAPKDPAERRNGFFMLFETHIEATARPSGKPSQEVYLEGSYLIDKARYIGGVEDTHMLELLRTCEGFRTLVHSIGVSVKAEHNQGDITFLLQNWGKTDKYTSGTALRLPCPADGTELILQLEQIEWSADDDVPGKFAFEFDQAGGLAVASIIFYLNDGYCAPELSPETPVAFGSEPYRDMISHSLLHPGNNVRLKAAIDKASRGEDVTIAYIGGSITQGAGAKPIHTECYAYQSYLGFKALYGRDGGGKVHFIKAGVGGTPSELGIIRYERDVLREGAAEPDIVIVEFAVNDEGDETKGNCYESLCLNILSADNQPAVVLLFSVFINDWNLQERLSPVGLRYNLPMVSVKDAVTGQFKLTKAEGNVISKRQFFYDIYHPANDGHRVMADCLIHLFQQAAAAPADPADIDLQQPPVIGNDFRNIRLLDRSGSLSHVRIEPGSFTETDTDLQMVELDDNPSGTPEFPYNWMRLAEAGGEPFRLTITSRILILVFKDSGSASFGSADVRVDGRPVLTADPHVNNWTHCNAVLLYHQQTSSEHTVEITMADGDQDKCFTILGFGYC
ncbi:acyl-CoA thioesterase [Paenibacillus sp. FSL R7-0273]|uniref:SGNH/GDSL hydrolase family protein n=1 Tax=Paenibacillus sp. FSL R7-0273 TaxID=1536772 RepID=UPI0004F6D0FC|nr:SGNH/GDSL hydrolase family protein [Paenibacillus sp. FSL R7-0273]AIQ46630.1 acyl-CoA thioesterase [Paenibacillus sp. FSL R7-0273]OMF97598.1 acyl-CoA thioesterase [Paenibacillus sp. FSL R7-0273]